MVGSVIFKSFTIFDWYYFIPVLKHNILNRRNNSISTGIPLCLLFGCTKFSKQYSVLQFVSVKLGSSDLRYVFFQTVLVLLDGFNHILLVS